MRGLALMAAEWPELGGGRNGASLSHGPDLASHNVSAVVAGEASR